MISILISHTLLSLAALQDPAAQAPTADPQLTRAWERWEQFEAEDHRLMAASIEQYVLGSEHPKLRALAALLDPARAAKVLENSELPRFEAKEYAPALKLKTKVLQPSSSTWKRLAKRYGIDADALPSAHWRWSSGRQALLAPDGERATPRARIESLLQGRLPEPESWLARIEAALDFDPLLQQSAAYFEHTYRDRDGRVYEGISLAMMWSSQREFGISDVEAVAFMRTILDDDSIRSPIPSRLHNGIYALIRDEYASVREAEQLRKALAAAFFHDHDRIPIVLRGVAPRLDLAWALVGDDPARMRAWLQEHPTRKAFLGSIEQRIAARLEADGISEQELATRPGAISAILALRAREGMAREGLMGFRGR
ncbi:MAG: hypothetical protein CMJ94_04005 [Planctomycetes bacterium]|nr:hypothetical protein [Planctomycetota bacterium]